MLKMKYKLISAAMVIAPLLSTGVASTVHANPAHGSSRPGIVYKYSFGSFQNKLDDLVASGVINSYQESAVLDVFNAGGNFKDGLDDLVTSGIINSYQESRILNVSYNFAPEYKISPAQGYKDLGHKDVGHKDVGNKDAGHKDNSNKGNTNKGGTAISNGGASHSASHSASHK